MRFVDSHMHLSDYQDVGEILVSAEVTGTMLLACSTDEATSRRTLSLAKESESHVRAFVGVHPSEAEKNLHVDWLEALCEEASGVGEVGLDPKYSDAGFGSQQSKLLSQQLGIAERAGKPLELHSRNAEAACLEELSTYRLKTVLLHWFNGEAELRRAEENGYFVSFGPALLASKKLQRMAVSYDLDLITAESDGPVRIESLGGMVGPPAVPSVVFALAELRGIPFEEMAEATTRNAMDFLSAAGKVKPTTESGLSRNIGQD